MRIRELNIVALALALAAALPAAAQERERHNPPGGLHEAVRHAHLAAAQAARLAATVAPVALAEAQHAVMAVTPVALAHAEYIAATVAPAALASVGPTLAALEPAMAGLGAAVAAAVADVQDLAFEFDSYEFDDSPPAPWAQQDPADSLYRAARRALNDQNYALAAELFRRIHSESRYRASEYRALAYYYEALSRQRIGGRDELQRARASLERMRSQHASAWREHNDANALHARITADLARLGEARAAQAMHASGSSAARGACTDQNMVVKIEALNALLHMDAENAVPILEEVMKKRGDECSAELRRKAVFLISQKRTDRTADLLLEAARNDPDAEVQEQAVFWLSQVDSDKAVQALEQVLKSTSSRKVQEKAVFALSQHRSDRATALLRDYAMRTDIPADLRANAIFWIGQGRGPDNARFLREIYPRIEEREVREKVIFAMSQIRGEESADWLLARALDQNEAPELRKNALFWAGQQRSIPIARLNELFERMPGKEMKEQLVFVLSQRARDPQAVDILIRIAREEKDPEIRKQAIFWLGQSKDPRAAKFLLELIKN